MMLRDVLWIKHENMKVLKNPSTEIMCIKH